LDESDRRREDEWFLKNERELLEAARVAREKREAERSTREKDEERKRLREAHFMKCPKCGHALREEVMEGVTIDRCTFCEGVFFDAGELERIAFRKDEARKGFLRRLLGD
jgi:Zn-finger nucleic acid-binding protein/predicted RNA-binding protein with PIN domain